MHRSLVISRKVQKWCSAGVKTAFNFNVSLEKIRNWKQASLRRSLNDVFTPNKNTNGGKPTKVKKKMLHAAQERQKNYQNCSRCWWKVKIYCNSTPATGSTLLLLLLAVTGKYLIVSKNPPVTVLVWITQGFMFGVNTPVGTPSLWHHEDWRVLKTKKKLRSWAFWSPSLWLTRMTDLVFRHVTENKEKHIRSTFPTKQGVIYTLKKVEPGINRMFVCLSLPHLSGASLCQKESTTSARHSYS